MKILVRNKSGLVYRDSTPEEDAEMEKIANSPEAIYAEINMLKRELAETDYIAIKIAEGAATVEEYIDKIRHREELRERIRECESLLTEE